MSDSPFSKFKGSEDGFFWGGRVKPADLPKNVIYLQQGSPDDRYMVLAGSPSVLHSEFTIINNLTVRLVAFADIILIFCIRKQSENAQECR